MGKVAKFLSAVLCAGMLLTSCASEEVGDIGQSQSVTFNLAFENEIASRAFGDGSKANKLYYSVFKSGETEAYKSGEQDLDSSLSIDLPRGTNYDVVFWAQTSNTSAFSYTASTGVVNVDYTKFTTNDDANDAFFAGIKGISVGSTAIDVVLKRPFAQFNVGTTSISDAGFTPTNITSVTSTTLPNVLNLKDGSVSGSVSVTYGAAGVASGETFPVNGYDYVAMNYMLCPAGSSIMPTITVTFYNSGSEICSLPLRNITLQRNYRTNVYGSFLSGSTTFNISIDPGFTGDSSSPSSGGTSQGGDPGQTTTDPQPTGQLTWNSDHTLCQVYTLDQLREAIKECEESGYTPTIRLEADIDLDNEKIEPIVLTKIFKGEVTLDGNGKTISNAEIIPHGEQSGLFCSDITSTKKAVYRLKVQNLNFSNISTVMTGKGNNTPAHAGVVAALFIGTIEKVTVTGYTITNGSDVNQTNMGGIVGGLPFKDMSLEFHDPTTIRECVVRNMKTENAAVVGGIIGYIESDGTTSGYASTEEHSLYKCNTFDSQLECIYNQNNIYHRGTLIGRVRAGEINPTITPSDTSDSGNTSSGKPLTDQIGK